MSLLSEQLLTFAEVATWLRRDYATIWRWSKSGVPGPDGEPVRLESVRVGGNSLTSREAVERFIERCTPEAACAR
jgi:hypothetical protein